MSHMEFLKLRKHFAPKDLAYMAGVSVKTIYNWIHLGKLRVIKINGSKHGRIRIPIEEVERILSGRPDRRKNETNKEEEERELRRKVVSQNRKGANVLEEDESMYTWRG